jgi:hypothetical protein
MSGYNLSSILEQGTAGSRVPENESPLGFLKRRSHSRFRVPGFLGEGIHPGFGFLETEPEADTLQLYVIETFGISKRNIEQF